MNSLVYLSVFFVLMIIFAYIINRKINAELEVEKKLPVVFRGKTSPNKIIEKGIITIFLEKKVL